ncbi:O-Methyltransferase involved in polyketide biosynthesis [Austwickia chelonae]|uniref:Methyltransferase n=1 Tax=Austwickia chelonae NBRC 105200 TaxID=1184607 RepID=K6VAV7_9MICO|nr:class I SAM-dependent methyltransferase [Austwickia chelonae]GAB79383.1 hypothetical protein AUCHE_24_00380 [Austwickia chelonae NBRC 105200]SEW43677.1 O-Methyltransferase involved in polyketide biosynthesis [Austwickia chelonae]
MAIDKNTEPRPLFGNAVGSTLVTALYARAFGAQMFDVPEWEDPQALQAWQALAPLAAEQGIDLESLVLKEDVNVVGTIRRSQALDSRVCEFVAAHPGAQIVTLGVGLCNRASRLADLDAEWVGVDFPAVVDLRRRLLPEDATRLVAGSATDRPWLSEIDPTRPAVFVAEGFLMYLDRARVTQLLVRISDRMCAPVRVVADMHHSLFVLPTSPITGRTGADYHFGVSSPQAFAELSPGWSLVGADDTMAPIKPSSARISRVFALATKGMAFGVVTIENDR